MSPRGEPVMPSESTFRCAALLIVVCALAACTGSAVPDGAMDSLRDENVSPKYGSGFWAEEAKKGSPLWAKAQEYCRLPDNLQGANCRIVLAVDLTIHAAPMSLTDDASAREDAFIRRGADHLGKLQAAPRTGFRDPPPIPAPPRR